MPDAPTTTAGGSRRAAATGGGALVGLFPGQGSQTPQMRALAQRFAPDLLRRCVELVGEDPFARVAESTRFAQPAICCASLAALAAHERAAAARPDGPAFPIAYAGHSLGELAALVAAGVLRPLDALELAVRRGALMAQSGEGQGGGGMLALIGASEQQCEELVKQHGVVVANDNAPGQMVLAGDRASLRDARRGAREQGLRAIELDVAGAFHSPAMADAVEPFRRALDEVAMEQPHTPVLSCASAQPFSDVRAELAAAIVMPVRWRATMGALAGMGARTFLDFGPGKVLAKLAARNVEGAQTVEPLVEPDGVASAPEAENGGRVPEAENGGRVPEAEGDGRANAAGGGGPVPNAVREERVDRAA